MSKENRKNIPEKKKEQRNQHDTSADNILEEKPEGRHFNEDVRPRHQKPEDKLQSEPHGYLGAEEVDSDEASVDSEQDVTSPTERSTPEVTAPEIRENRTEEEEETLEQVKRDMTGG